MNHRAAIDVVDDAETELATLLVALADRHVGEPDVHDLALARARLSAEHSRRLQQFTEPDETAVIDIDPSDRRTGSAGETDLPAELIGDLRNAYVAAHRVDIAWIVVQQAASAARDEDLAAVAAICQGETEQTWKWLRTRIKDGAAQALVIG